MEVTAKYELIGLMAYPIRHSLSPTMQNCALEKMGLPICYMAFEVDNASFPDAIKASSCAEDARHGRFHAQQAARHRIR